MSLMILIHTPNLGTHAICLYKSLDADGGTQQHDTCTYTVWSLQPSSCFTTLPCCVLTQKAAEHHTAFCSPPTLSQWGWWKE